MDVEKKLRSKKLEQDPTIDREQEMSKYFHNIDRLEQEDKDIIATCFQDMNDETSSNNNGSQQDPDRVTRQQDPDRPPKIYHNIFSRLFQHYTQHRGGFTDYFGLFESINLRMIDKYFEPLYFIIKSWSKQKQIEVAQQGLTILARRVENLSNAEIKDLESDYLKEQLNESLIFRNYEQRSQLVERIVLTMALKFLNTQYLEKRVRALIDIKELAERLDGVQMKMRPSITREELVTWINENQILEKVLIGDTLHSELIKRATDIAIFLCKNNRFQVGMIDQIWETSQNKHESTLRSIYEFFEQLSGHMNLETMDRLYSFISRIEEHSEMSVRLLCKFTENALQVKQVDDEAVDLNKFYGFNQLWQILQDRNDGQVAHCIQEQAFHAARAIVSTIPQTKVFNHYFFAKCFELIRDHQSVYQAISFTHYILDKQFVNDNAGKQQLILETDHKFNIVELFVLDIEVYLQVVRQFFNNQEIKDVIVSGVQTFQQNMFFRVQMLNYILSISELTITYEQTLRLWNACCVETKGSIQKQELLKVFQSDKENHPSISQRFFSDKSIQFRFFTQGLCNFEVCNYQNLIIEELRLFQMFFYEVNFAMQKFQEVQNKCIVVELNYEGKEALFKMFEQVQDAVVLEHVIQFIVEHYSNFQDVQQQLAHRELMDMCLHLMPRQSTRCLSLLQAFFNGYQHGHYFSQNPSCLEMLFQVLEQDDGNGAQVWDLLAKLPLNQHYQGKVKQMDLQWGEVLSGGFYRVLYQMQTVYRQSHHHEEWKVRFLESGGLEQILNLFLTFKFNFKARYLELTLAYILVELLNHYQAQKLLQLDQKAIEKQCSHILFQLSVNNKTLDQIEGDLAQQIFLLVEDAEQFLCSIGPESIIRSLLVCNSNQYLKQTLKDTLLKCNTLSPSLQDILINQTLQYILTNQSQESQQYFETMVELLKNHKIQQLPEALIERLVHQLTFVDGHVRAGVYTLLAQVAPTLSIAHAKVIINTIKDQLLGNEINAQALSCLQSVLINPTTVDHFVSRYEAIHLCTLWRSKSYSQWSLQSKLNEKSSTGYVGLYNLACICYMNSLMQQLFMIPAFRESIMSAEDMQATTTLPSENMLYQLQCVMAALKFSHKQYFSPKKFCHAFKDLDGLPTNVFEQMDVDEFFNLLMDRVESALKGGRNQTLVQDNFRGFMVNEVIGECQHKSECEEPFFVISLPVKNKKSIMASLKSIVQGDLLEGENAYLCEQCGRKVNATKRMSIKRLPPQLILVLKRFEFDFDSMAKVKVNDKCEFPFELDMLPYSQQALNNLPGYAESEFQYELKGVVIHQGSADSGHYYSFIQEARDRRWLEFNDNCVSEAKQQEIINDGFGGGGGGDRRSKLMERSKNAYLLFYERKALTQIIEERPLQPQLLTFIQELSDENDKFQIQRIVFHNDYFKLLHHTYITHNRFTEDLAANPHLQPKLVIFVLQFALTCAVREYSKLWIQANFQRLMDHIRRTPEAAEFLCRTFECQAYLKEFLQECPFGSIRKYVVSMISQAATLTRNYNTDAALIFLSGEGKQKNYTEFLDLVQRLARVYPNQMIVSGAIERLLDFFLLGNYKGKKLRLNQDDVKLELVQPNEVLYLGEQENEASSYYDEIIEKRFERGSSRYQSRQYLWMALEVLIRNTTLGEGQHKITQVEHKILFSDFSIYVAMIEDADCKQALIAISGLVCMLSRHNPLLTDAMISILMKMLCDKEYREYYIQMTIIAFLMAVEDNLQDQRIESFLDQILSLTQKQTLYFFETDVCQQYLLRFCVTNPKVRKWMVDNQQKWIWILQQLKDQTAPQEKLLVNNITATHCKHRLYGLYLAFNRESYAMFLHWKMQQFMLLQHDEPLEVNPQDVYVTLKHVQQGDFVDFHYFPQSKWIQPQVKEVNDEYLTLSFKDMMVERDSELLAPYQTLSFVNKIPGDSVEPLIVDHEDMTLEDNNTEEGNYVSQMSQSGDDQ